MTDERKDDGAPKTAGAPGNVSSAGTPAPTLPWTDEEMRAAVPLPLPTGDTGAPAQTPADPYAGQDAGQGQTEPAGRPDDN